MVDPITPTDLESLQVRDIPDEVITAVNALIQRHWVGSSARMSSRDITDAIDEPTHLYRGLWDQVATRYRQSGWSVSYDTSGVSAVFTFSHDPVCAPYKAGERVQVVRDLRYGQDSKISLKGETVTYIRPTGDAWYPHRVKYGVEEFVVAEVRHAHTQRS